jgi:hypothetical protein
MIIGTFTMPGTELHSAWLSGRGAASKMSAVSRMSARQGLCTARAGRTPQRTRRADRAPQPQKGQEREQGERPSSPKRHHMRSGYSSANWEVYGYPQRDKRLHLLRIGREMILAVRNVLPFTEMAIDPDCWPAGSNIAC